ncbi:sialate O-acetylesterase-like isoform X2 [Littorina saxatilis]|uniref:Sialate O-acetylesterase domain-containing protein n=1 Tax=Littorina saxatilis TaxID=31220 RepID=A0AAN9BLZ8_9CAEN
MASACVLIFLLAAFFHQGECALLLNSYFSDHMVLQRAPQQAVLWGTADTEGDIITAKVTGQGSDSTPVTTKVTQGQWKVKLPAQNAGGPYIVNVHSHDGDVTFSDVLFGDVWLCSGQSNMGVKMNQIINASEEIKTAQSFPQVRFTRVNFTQSDTPQSSVFYNIPWTTPNNRVFEYFSSVCFLFGEYLHPHVNHPIGLVLSYWGGTLVEAWSPPQAIGQCQHRSKRGPRGDSILWNAMINPLLSTTLYGAIWYQGESNSYHYDRYSCQIIAMLKEWRKQFHQQSLQQTSANFPFGYVQLAPNAPGDAVGLFPEERWAQTANYGYSPNPALPNTFMAVTMDLPDYDSPSGSIHPRYKQDVAKRLVLGALNQAYGHSDVIFQGPFPTAINANGDPHELTIEYDHGKTELDVRSNGFEVCCSVLNTTHCDDVLDTWVDAPISRTSGSLVTISTSGCGSRHVVGMRYEWRTSPCDLKLCSLYGKTSGLPAPPYITRSISEHNSAIIG